MENITPILLAGGFGQRLWPLSRKSYPKQFSKFVSDNSLFQETALRLTSSEYIKFLPHITLTNDEYRFIVGEQLQAVGLKSDNILIEPVAKNTAPAILAATVYSFNKNKDSILLVCPSDHIIKEKDKFHESIFKSIPLIKKGKIITFGSKPSRPETGYGYLKFKKTNKEEVYNVTQFIEKPSFEKAKLMSSSEKYLWNAGIFLFKAKDMIDAYKRYAPKLIKSVTNALKEGQYDLDFLRLESKFWNQCENVSIDYKIMEKAENLAVIPFDASWSDLGDWNAVWKEMSPDEKGVSQSKNAISIGCSNTLLRSENTNQQIVGLNLENIVAVSMQDAVLVASKDKIQDVKKIVERLKEEKIQQAEIFPKEHRPWGWFESLALSNRFQVKKILVKSGAALSLQSHYHRSEHWIVVEGTAEITINKENKMLSEGQSCYVPLGAIHRIKNPGKVPLILIEVQTGCYLKEDDIKRYEDVYSRR